MANGIGGLFEGLGTGFLQGAQLGLLARRQRFLEEAEGRQTGLLAFKTLGEIATVYRQAPAFGEFLIKQGLPLVGIERGSELEKDFLSFMKRASDEELEGLKSTTDLLGISGLPPQSLGFLARRPDLLLEVIKLQRSQKVLGEAEPLPMLQGSTGEHPALVERPALMEGFEPGGVSVVEQYLSDVIRKSRAALAAGDTGTSNALLGQARLVLENAPAAIRERELGKPIPLDLLSETGLPVGSTFKDAMGIALRPPEEREAEITRRRKEAEAEVELERPVGEKAAEFIHPKTFQSPPPGLSQRELNRQGYVKVDDKSKRDLLLLLSVDQVVQNVNELSGRLITAETASDAALQGARLTAEAFARTNPEAVAYQDGRQAFLGVISRSLGAERGVLTDRDIKRLETLLPSFRDTAAARDAKLSILNGMLKTAVETQKKIVLGDLDVDAARLKIRARVEASFKKAEGLEPEEKFPERGAPTGRNALPSGPGEVFSAIEDFESGREVKASEIVRHLTQKFKMTEAAAEGFVRRYLTREAAPARERHAPVVR